MARSQPYTVAVNGGLVKSANVIDLLKTPGVAKDLRNFEVSIEGGYRRINGYQKFGTSSAVQPTGGTTNILGVVTWVLGIFTVLSFNNLSGLKFFGMTIFDNIDYLTSKIMLPLGGLLMALFAGFIMKRAIVSSELNSNMFLVNVWFILLKVFSPILLIIIFVNGII